MRDDRSADEITATITCAIGELIDAGPEYLPTITSLQALRRLFEECPAVVELTRKECQLLMISLRAAGPDGSTFLHNLYVRLGVFLQDTARDTAINRAVEACR